MHAAEAPLTRRLYFQESPPVSSTAAGQRETGRGVKAAHWWRGMRARHTHCEGVRPQIHTEPGKSEALYWQQLPFCCMFYFPPPKSLAVYQATSPKDVCSSQKKLWSEPRKKKKKQLQEIQLLRQVSPLPSNRERDLDNTNAIRIPSNIAVKDRDHYILI